MDCIINGILVRVGQRWRTRSGRIVDVAKVDPRDGMCLGSDDWWRNSLSGVAGLEEDDFDILVEDVPEQAASPALPDVGSWWVDKTSGKIVLVTSVDVAYMTVQVRLRHLIGDVHISMFSGHYRPALTHEIPGEHREPFEPMRIGPRPKDERHRVELRYRAPTATLDDDDRAKWERRYLSKCARGLESAAQAEAARARRAAMPVHQGGMRVPTEVPAAMVMLTGMKR